MLPILRYFGQKCRKTRVFLVFYKKSAISLHFGLRPSSVWLCVAVIIIANNYAINNMATTLLKLQEFLIKATKYHVHRPKALCTDGLRPCATTCIPLGLRPPLRPTASRTCSTLRVCYWHCKRPLAYACLGLRPVAHVPCGPTLRPTALCMHLAFGLRVYVSSSPDVLWIRNNCVVFVFFARVCAWPSAYALVVF